MNCWLPAQLTLSLHVRRFQIWSIPQKRIRKLAQAVIEDVPVQAMDRVCKQDPTKPNAYMHIVVDELLVARTAHTVSIRTVLSKR